MINALKKLDYNYLKGGISFLSIEQAVSLVFGLASAYVFANYLDPNIYGQYKYVLTIVSILAIFTLTGSAENIIRNVAKSSPALKKNAGQYIRYGIPAAVAGLGIAIYYLFRDDPTIGLSMLIASFLFIPLHGFKLYGAYWTGKKNFSRKALLSILQQTIPIVATIYAVLSGYDLVAIVSILFATQLLVALSIFIHSIQDEAKTLQSIDQNTQGIETPFNFHLSISHSIKQLSKIIDNLLLFQYLGATPLAIYAISLLPVQELNRLPQMLRTLLLPRISRYEHIDVLRNVPKKIGLALLLVTPLTVLYIIAAPYLFNLFFPQYAEHVLITQVLSLILLTTPFFVIEQTFIAFGRIKELYIVNTSSLVGAVLLFAILVPIFGLLGAAISRVLNGLVRFLICLILFLIVSKSEQKRNRLSK